MKKGILALCLAGAAGAAAYLLLPKKAHASSGSGPLDSGDDGTPNVVLPKTAQEAYAIAMNPALKDPEQVHSYALWLSSSGQRPDWAAAVEQRAVNLRAEQALTRGLLAITSLADVEALGRQLAMAPAHQPYASVLASRIAVERGATPPAAFMLTLLSGGELRVDLSAFAKSGASTASPAGASVVVPLPPSTPAIAPAPNGPMVPVVPAVPIVPSSPVSPSSALADEETKPQNDPNGTIALARFLLDEQSRAGWKAVSQAVLDWQRRVGLTADGWFGPGSALRMATEVGVLPWIRAYPKGSPSKVAAVSDFRSRLKALALDLARKYPERAEHAASLLRCAELEVGQSWPARPAPAPARPPTPAEIDSAVTVLKSELRQQSLKVSK